MLFTSIDFALFFVVVFFLYWFVFNRNLVLQNIFVVTASFVFYGWWDVRFLALLFSACFMNYLAGRLLEKYQQKPARKFILIAAVVYNIGLLAVFKYLNFFISSFAEVFTFFGQKITTHTLNIVLPVGISFYTLQALGYVIEVYRKNVPATKNIINFSAFVSFFPLLFAGPIERATHLLPQFSRKRIFEYSKATDALRQILWGLFKKIVIADNCAVFADTIFNNPADYSGSTLVLGAVLYTIQIYADFSGYSDIAIGVGRLLGFDILKNFNFPYFSVNVADFWRRWHITLSTWLRDYLYNPLAVKVRSWGKTGIVFSLFITFLICGLWHGANYTFVVWGALHGLALAWDVISMKYRVKIKKKLKTLTAYNFFSWGITMVFIVFTWIFFRADNLHHAVGFIKSIFSGLLSKASLVDTLNFLRWEIGFTLPFFLLLFFVLEWLGRKQQYAIEHLGLRWNRAFRWLFYYAMLFAVLYFSGREQQFIYFQF